MTDHYDGRARQRRNRVKVGKQYLRYLMRRTSRVMPPPTPVNMPRRADMTGFSPNSIAPFAQPQIA
jgi:hypothetical protein